MKLTPSTTTPTTTPCLTRGRRPRVIACKREVRVRVPASSTTTHGPERSGYRLENAPKPHQLVRATDVSRRRSSDRQSAAQFLRRTPALLRAEDGGLSRT